MFVCVRHREVCVSVEGKRVCLCTRVRERYVYERERKKETERERGRDSVLICV